MLQLTIQSTLPIIILIIAGIALAIFLFWKKKEKHHVHINNFDSWSAAEQNMFKLINEYRESKGVRLLVPSAILYDYCQKRSIEVSRIPGTKFKEHGHDLFNLIHRQSIADKGFRNVSEVLYRGSILSSTAVVTGWKNSSRHRDILKDSHPTEVAIASYGYRTKSGVIAVIVTAIFAEDL